MKKLTDYERVEMVLTSFQEGVVITKHAEKYGVSRATFYRAKRLVMGAILAAMTRERKAKKKHSLVKKNGKKYYQCKIK